MHHIANDGWSKQENQQFVYGNTHNSVAHLKRTERLAGTLTAADETTMRPLVPSPQDVLVVAAGGPAGALSPSNPGGGGGQKTSPRHTKLILEKRGGWAWGRPTR